MRKTVLVFGLLSGAVSSSMMLITRPFMDRIGYERAEVIGYATIVASFLFVYFGVRSYRDRIAGGSISFGRTAGVGLLITLVSCGCYVATWEFIYFGLDSPFVEQYAAYAIEQAQASGASGEQIADLARQMQEFAILYDNPLYNAALTFLEPFPIGVVVTLLSAAVLRRRAALGVTPGN